MSQELPPRLRDWRMPTDEPVPAYNKAENKVDAAFTRKETKAIEGRQTIVDRNGKRWSLMKIDGVEIKIVVQITLPDVGIYLCDPQTKSQRREIRGLLGLNKSETV